jgi:septal ring factor EnvC (AmiA/AmiB activator)
MSDKPLDRCLYRANHTQGKQRTTGRELNKKEMELEQLRRDRDDLNVELSVSDRKWMELNDKVINLTLTITKLEDEIRSSRVSDKCAEDEEPHFLAKERNYEFCIQDDKVKI